MLNSLLSIDGGGTKTAALVADVSGQAHDLNSSLGCNLQDGTGWKESLHKILAQVENIDFAVIGIPGFGEVPQHDEMVSTFFSTELNAPHLIINDVEMAFRGAFPGGDGTLVLAGTGSMAFAGSQGVFRRAGGWGHYIGDEGSAFWVGQQALAHAVAELDGRRSSDGFAIRLTKALGAPSHRFGLLDWVVSSGNERAQIASVAQVIDALDQTGDRTAGSILDAAAVHLIDLARAVSSTPIPWSHSGSVFNSTRILTAVSQDLGPPTQPAASTLVGGLFHAANLANWSIDPNWIAQVSAQADKT